MGRFVIAAYRPKPGQEPALVALLHKHTAILRERNLTTDRPAYLMRSRDGAYVEVFEWSSAEAIERAHSDPAVQSLWEAFEQACDYAPLGALHEAHQLFAEFESLS